MHLVLSDMQNRTFGSFSAAVPCCRGSEGRGSCVRCATDTNRMQLVLHGMQNTAFGAFLAAMHRILIPVMVEGAMNHVVITETIR
jgi:hypothetical protein